MDVRCYLSIRIGRTKPLLNVAPAMAAALPAAGAAAAAGGAAQVPFVLCIHVLPDGLIRRFD